MLHSDVRHRRDAAREHNAEEWAKRMETAMEIGRKAITREDAHAELKKLPAPDMWCTEVGPCHQLDDHAAHTSHPGSS